MEVKLADFEELPEFDCPAEFWPALGYDGEWRYVAIWWQSGGGEACWSDGRKMVVGAAWGAYQALVDHNFPWGHKAHELLGSSERIASHRLIIDRETERAWLVPAREAEEILGLQRHFLAPPGRTLFVGPDWKGWASDLSGWAIPNGDPAAIRSIQATERYEALIAALGTRKRDARRGW